MYTESTSYRVTHRTKSAFLLSTLHATHLDTADTKSTTPLHDRYGLLRSDHDVVLLAQPPAHRGQGQEPRTYLAVMRHSTLDEFRCN